MSAAAGVKQQRWEQQLTPLDENGRSIQSSMPGLRGCIFFISMYFSSGDFTDEKNLEPLQFTILQVIARALQGRCDLIP